MMVNKLMPQSVRIQKCVQHCPLPICMHLSSCWNILITLVYLRQKPNLDSVSASLALECLTYLSSGNSASAHTEADMRKWWTQSGLYPHVDICFEGERVSALGVFCHSVVSVVVSSNAGKKFGYSWEVWLFYQPSVPDTQPRSSSRSDSRY